MTITLHPGRVSLAELAQIYWSGESAVLDRSFDAGIEKAAARIAEIAAGNAGLWHQYRLRQTRLDQDRCGRHGDAAAQSDPVALLRRGPAAGANIVRLIMALKLISLGRGASGVRLDLVRLIEGMLEKGVTPLIPEKGSVGASGDLAPLAHMAAVMMGEAEAFYEGERLSGAEALKRAGLTPVVLAAKEGLALINGTRPRRRWRWPACSAPIEPHRQR